MGWQVVSAVRTVTPGRHAPALLVGCCLRLRSEAGIIFGMQLAFSTNAYTRFSLIEAMRGIREAGFVGVEILADEPHAYPARFSAADAEGVAGELRRLGLGVSNVNVNCSFGYWKDAPPEPYFEPSLISPNQRHREDRIELIGKAIRIAKVVGARNISITSGRMLGSMSPVEGGGAV